MKRAQRTGSICLHLLALAQSATSASFGMGLEKHQYGSIKPSAGTPVRTRRELAECAPSNLTAGNKKKN